MAKRLIVAVVAVLLLAPAAAEAAFPGANGKIAFVRGDDIWTMNPDGTGQVNLTNSTGVIEADPAWSADGNSIAFERGGEIWRMLADGTAQANVTAGAPGCCGKDGPSWSPDGQKLSYAVDGRCETGGPEFENGGVWVIDNDGTDPTQVGCVFDGDDRGYNSTAWSPDGSTIAFSANLAKFDIYTIPAVLAGPGPNVGTNLLDDFSYFDVNPNWSPDNTKIAWDTDRDALEPFLWKMNSDGTDKSRITTGTHREDEPAWSPDGTKIAYRQSAFVDPAGIYIANSDGTSPTFITDGDEPDWQPLNAPGPEADVLSTITDSPDPVPTGGILTYNVSAKNLVGPDDATGVTLTVDLPASVFFISATPSQGSCSEAAGVVTCNLGNLAVGQSASVQIQVEPQVNGSVTANANVSATEGDPVPGNNASSATTTISLGGFARPKGADIIRAALVPAYRACEPDQASLTHGPPLSHPSCAAPALTSGHLTVGTPDANARPSNSIGALRMIALFEGPPIDPDNGDQADVRYDLQLTDVRNASDLSDYTGELQAQATLRITDRENTPSMNAPATVQDTAISFTAPCTATASTSTGGACAISTTAEALIPGMIDERKRTIWELGRLRVFDGGADGDADTGPNTLFAVQGVFVP